MLYVDQKVIIFPRINDVKTLENFIYAIDLNDFLFAERYKDLSYI